MIITQNKKLHFKDLGIMEYSDAFAFQENLMNKTIAIKMENKKNDWSEDILNSESIKKLIFFNKINKNYE